jgi:hypothetical protein
MFVDLGIYSDVLEPAFLEQTKRYYMSSATSKVELLSGSAYLAWATQILKDEGEDRVRRYIDAGSQIKLVKAVEESIILENIDLIITKGTVCFGC